MLLAGVRMLRLAAVFLAAAAAGAEAQGAGGSCPEGSYAVQPKTPGQPVLCAPRKQEFAGAAGAACARFNAELARFHRERAEAAERLRELDRRREQLKAMIAQQRALRLSLQQDAFRSRSLIVRRHLRQQAAIVHQDTLERQAELQGIERELAALRAEYRGRAEQIRALRPEGCPVSL